MTDQIIQFGEHLTIDGYYGNPTLLNSKGTVLKVLSSLPVKLGMKILAPPTIVQAPDTHLKDPGGWSGFVVIAESHISIHTFPARGFLSADIYSCKNGLNIQEIIDYFIGIFKLGEVETHFIKRGTKYPMENLYKS